MAHRMTIRAGALAAAAVLALAAAPGFAQSGLESAARGGARLHADRDFMIGRWTDSGDCEEAVELGADGRFTAAGGSEGDWRMDGDLLTLAGDDVLTALIVRVDRDTIAVVNADGSLGRSTRCEGDQADPGFVAVNIT